MAEGYPTRLVPLLRLRLLVGFLGERSQFAWWPTSFFDPSSRLFLEPVFARTLATAQYHGVLEAARRFHDEHLSAGSFHLFRLPEEIEEDLHALVQAGENEPSSCPLSDKDAALSALKEMGNTAARDVVGPSSIGSVQDIAESAKIQEVAAIYATSFASNKQAIPYFVP